MNFEFDKLPDELFELIIQYLDPADLSRLSQVNKSFLENFNYKLALIKKGHTIAYYPSLALKGIKTEQIPAIIDLLKNYPDTSKKEEWQTRAAKIQEILGFDLCSILDECAKEPGKTYEQVISQLSCHNPVLLHELALCYLHSDALPFYTEGFAAAAHISANGKNFSSTFLFLYSNSLYALKNNFVDSLMVNFSKNFKNQEMVKNVNELIISFYQLENQISTDSNQWIKQFFHISCAIWGLNNNFKQELGSKYLLIYKNFCVLLQKYGFADTALLANSRYNFANEKIPYLKTFLLCDNLNFISHYRINELLECDAPELNVFFSAQFSDYCNRYPNLPIQIENLKALGVAACLFSPETKEALLEQFENIDNQEFDIRYHCLRTHPNETLFFGKFITPPTILEFDSSLFYVLISNTTIAHYLLEDCIDIAHRTFDEIVKIEKQNVEIILSKINKSTVNILGDVIISAENGGYSLDHPFLSALLNIYTVEEILVSDMTVTVKTLAISQGDFDEKFLRSSFFDKILEPAENSATTNSLFKALVNLSDKVQFITQNEDFSVLRLLFTVLEKDEEVTQQKILEEIFSKDDLLQGLHYIILVLKKRWGMKERGKIYFRIGNLPSINFLQLLKAMSEKKSGDLEFYKLLLMPKFTDKTITKVLRLLIIKLNQKSLFSQENYAILHTIISDFNALPDFISHKISIERLNVLIYKLSLPDLAKLHKEKLIISNLEKNFELSLLQIVCYDFTAEAKNLNYFDQIKTTSKEARSDLIRQLLNSTETIFDNFKDWLKLQHQNKMETDETTKFIFFPKQTTSDKRKREEEVTEESNESMDYSKKNNQAKS